MEWRNGRSDGVAVEDRKSSQTVIILSTTLQAVNVSYGRFFRARKKAIERWNSKNEGK